MLQTISLSEDDAWSAFQIAGITHRKQDLLDSGYTCVPVLIVEGGGNV